jgi:hypothetical protein
MPSMMKGAEKALHKQTNKMFVGATKRYKKFMRQATKAASDHKREQYLAAALGALVVTGVVAKKLVARIERSRSPMSSASSAKKGRKKTRR